MAARKAKARGSSERVRFEVDDANHWQPEPESFDVIWIMESSEHFPDKKHFFERCAIALRPGGSLDSLSKYRQWMHDVALTVTAAEDITRQVEPTWAQCSRLGENSVLKFLVRFTGGPTRRFVKAFPLMQEAYDKRRNGVWIICCKKAIAAVHRWRCGERRS